MSVPATSVRRSPRNHQHPTTYSPRNTLHHRLSSSTTPTLSSLAQASPTTNASGSPTSNTSSARSLYSPPAMNQHSHYFPPHNANIPAAAQQVGSNGGILENGTIAQSPGFKATKLIRRSSKKGTTPINPSAVMRGDRDRLEDTSVQSKPPSGAHARHGSPTPSMVAETTAANGTQHYGNINTRSASNTHGSASTPAQIMARIRSSSSAVPQMSPTNAQGNSIPSSHHQYHPAIPSPVRQDHEPDVFGPIAGPSPSASHSTMSPTPKMLRSSSIRVASTSTAVGADDFDPIGLGIRSSSPAGPSLDLTAVYATSASTSTTVSPIASPHAATRGRNRRKSYMVADVKDAVDSDSCEIGRSGQTVRSRMAPAPPTDRRTRSNSSSLQHSPSISPVQAASPRSRSPPLQSPEETAERPKTPERDPGNDRDSGVARIRAATSVDTGLNALSRGVTSSAGVATLIGSGVSGGAGLLVASPRKGKARDYGDR